MKKLSIILLFLFPMLAWAGTKYTHSATSGSITISQTTDGHLLVAGDTIALNPAGVYNLVQIQGLNGGSGNNIVVLGNGSYSTSLATFRQPYWNDVSYVKVIGLKDSLWSGTHKFGTTIHDVIFDRWIGVSTTNATYYGQPFHQWDDAFASPNMVFAGSKAKTFYNITYSNCRFKNFVDMGIGIIYIGSQWSSGNENRSIALDWTFDRDTIQNLMNTSAGTNGNTSNGITGTGWGIVVKNCYFTKIVSAANSFTRSHNAAFEWYGGIDGYNNKMDSSYAQMFRHVPLNWFGLPGYARGSRRWNNITFEKESYGMDESGQNNKANRNSTYLIYPSADTIVHNTVHRTNGNTYFAGGGVYKYHGVVVDNVNQDTLYVADNVITQREKDHPYVSSSQDTVWVAQISTPDPHGTTTSNQQARYAVTFYEDSALFIPKTGSALLDAGHTYPFRTTDIYGNPMNGTPDDGAVERQAAGSPPSCTTNLLPANGSTVNDTASATLEWSAASGATSYDLRYKVSGGSYSAPINTAALTYTITGLTPGAVYNWYVTPKNTDGDATGCATGFWVFSTQPRYRVIRIYRK